MTTPNDLPSVGTEDARLKANQLAAVDFVDAADMLRALVSERDMLAARVRELEGARTWVGLNDDDRRKAFESLPDMLDGFLKKWGWLHFAKAIEEICREKNDAKNRSEISPLLNAERQRRAPDRFASSTPSACETLRFGGCPSCGNASCVARQCTQLNAAPTAPTEATQPPAQPSAAAEREVLSEREFSEWLNANRDQRVASVFHDVVANYTAALSATPPAPQDAVDAERYRWLRRADAPFDVWTDDPDGFIAHSATLDEAIDAAISAKAADK